MLKAMKFEVTHGHGGNNSGKEKIFFIECK